jgi:hypothetical protein
MDLFVSIHLGWLVLLSVPHSHCQIPSGRRPITQLYIQALLTILGAALRSEYLGEDEADPAAALRLMEEMRQS